MTNKLPIADLHCDLLCYLQGDPRRSAFDASVRCSIPQMLQGGVSLQVLPIFTVTEPGSTCKGWGQVEAFASLLKMDQFCRAQKAWKNQSASRIALLISVENASGLFEESDPLEVGFRRLETLSERFGPVVYISLTWNSENRFGGGAHTDIGLKEDGRALLHFLHGRGIAYDCSHNSDRLMREALAYMDAHQLDIPIVASHSNMRAVTDVPRNLPDDLAREIFRRGGLIGLNFYKSFVGASDVSLLSRHLEHVFRLGGEKQVCFGADFFDFFDLPPQYRKRPEDLFFAEVSDSSAYPFVLDLWQRELGLSIETLQDVAHRNFLTFSQRFAEKS